MESALQEAKELVQRMETFLGENESSVKKFLEDQKNEVIALSKPRVMQDSNTMGEGMVTRNN